MNNNPFTLKDKTILVTGASAGFGRSISIECSKIGANLILTGRNEERLDETISKMYGNQHLRISSDISDNEEIDKLVNQLPALDGIVLNAGIVITKPVKFITNNDIDEIFKVNITSSVKMINLLLRSKKIKSGASIVFISSIATSKVKIGNSLYSATKGAVNSFAKVLALELASKKIRVNIIQPGFIKTNIMDKGIITEEQIDTYLKQYPLGLGSPDDIAFASIYLLSNAAKWVTGSIFTIDGGYTLQ